MEKKYYLSDPETGYSYEVTKEHHESFMAMLESFRSTRLNNRPQGQVIIFGTGGDFSNNDSELFYQLNNEIEPYINQWPRKPINKYFMPSNIEKVESLFTPGQREEALAWIKDNCPVLKMASELNESQVTNLETCLIDMYFKLKQITFPLLKNEFVVGIEYKDKEAVIKGTEAINIRFQNPHKKGQYDDVAYMVLLELLNRLKS